jgi:hypothetical protein
MVFKFKSNLCIERPALLLAKLVSLFKISFESRVLLESLRLEANSASGLGLDGLTLDLSKLEILLVPSDRDRDYFRCTFVLLGLTTFFIKQKKKYTGPNPEFGLFGGWA